MWPPEDYSGLAPVRDIGMPMSAGESMTTLRDFKAALDAGAVDNLQPSVSKCGGISAMQSVFALASSYAVRVVPHCFYWGPGSHATAQIAAAQARPMLVKRHSSILQCSCMRNSISVTRSSN